MMKKILVIMMAVLMVVSAAACAKLPAEKDSAVLKDEGHAAWVAHGQYLLADGTQNAWNGKDSDLYEKSALKAISLEDVKAIDEALYETLKGKDVKYLYTIDLIFGTNDAGWTKDFVADGKLYRANGSYAFKIAQCNVDVDGDNKVYAEDQWISNPHDAYAESLTPKTMFMPVWQEEADENGFSWANDPVVIGGAGLYTLVIAQYNAVSAPGTPGFGIGLVLKEAKEGIAYEEIIPFVPADHTYGIVGSFEGSDWGNAGPDVEMTGGDGTWTGEVELKAGDQFKVRADNDWTNSWGNGADNFECEEDGVYVVTITFEGETPTITVNGK